MKLHEYIKNEVFEGLNIENASEITPLTSEQAKKIIAHLVVNSPFEIETTFLIFQSIGDIRHKMESVIFNLMNFYDDEKIEKQQYFLDTFQDTKITAIKIKEIEKDYQSEILEKVINKEKLAEIAYKAPEKINIFIFSNILKYFAKNTLNKEFN